MSAVDVPGPKIPFTPISLRKGRSDSGIIPPATIKVSFISNKRKAGSHPLFSPRFYGISMSLTSI